MNKEFSLTEKFEDLEYQFTIKYDELLEYKASKEFKGLPANKKILLESYEIYLENQRSLLTLMLMEDKCKAQFDWERY